MIKHVCRQITMLAMAAALMAQFGCATLSGDATNEQRFYEAKSQWNTVLSAAVVFAESPAGQIRPDVIRKIFAIASRVRRKSIDTVRRPR